MMIQKKQRIQRTKERVGELYPILIAKSKNPKINGKVVDGKTRVETGDWKKTETVDVKDWEDYHIKRISANIARKGVLDKSVNENIAGLYRIYRMQGFESEPAKRKMADIFGTSVRTIEKHLPKTVKREYHKSEGGSDLKQTTIDEISNPETAGVSHIPEEPKIQNHSQELMPESHTVIIDCPECGHEFEYDVKKKKVVKA